MALSMYDASVPVFARMLKNLSAILAKADPKTDPAEARLAADMLPLARQVQIACDAAKLCASRLSGVEAPSFPDVETTFPELRARIDKTLAFLDSVDAAAFEGSEAREVVLKMRDTELKLSGQMMLLGMAMPNFYFHVTTAYDILRRDGAQIGKRDFLGAP